MADATGEAREPLRVAFDRRLKLEFHGAKITSEPACSPTASWTTPSA
jgi:riboflavin biosynthesis pyrimidine reductase